jgi:hypothetical protein
LSPFPSFWAKLIVLDHSKPQIAKVDGVSFRFDADRSLLGLEIIDLPGESTSSQAADEPW